jgi:hypothetical protein
MIISDLDILEVVPEANQVKVSGALARARARANASGRVTSTHTRRYTHDTSNGSIAISSAESYSAT